MKLARLAPLVVVALVGCSPSPTTAAQVGDTTISTQTLSALLEDCPVVGQQEVTAPLAMNELVRMAAFQEVAESTGTEFDEDELRAMLMQDPNYGPFLTEQPGCVDLLIPGLAAITLPEQGDVEELNAALEALEISVNPRYGEWQEDSFAIEGSGSISTES